MKSASGHEKIPATFPKAVNSSNSVDLWYDGESH
jgi:hypothetical protein